MKFVMVVNMFVDDHFQKLSKISDETGNMRNNSCKTIYHIVVAHNMFVDDHFQKLSKISDETGNVCNNSCKIVR
ncbi:hypothetical protein Hanom_Chr06g00563451 [Helianthus anomalus]